MMVTESNRLITPLLAAALVVAAPAAAVTGHPAAVAAGAGQGAAAGYWTRARMAAAVPAGASAAPAAAASRNAWLTGNTGGRGLRWTHGGAVARSAGKVFFTLDRTDYVCSGTAVASTHADVVLTAAHCVSDGDGRRAANWVFVPGYRDGAEPYGSYPARRFFIPQGWPGSEQYDIAFVQVSSQTRLPAGLPVAFQARPAAPAKTYVFGYPSVAPYSGLYANYCAGPAQPGPGGSAHTGCTMTAGDSGGPWFAGFRPRSGTGTIVAVTTYKLAGNMKVLYGALLGPAARAAYLRAASVSPVR